MLIETSPGFTSIVNSFKSCISNFFLNDLIIPVSLAVASLRGALYEEKVVELIKNKIKLEKKNVNTKQAEEILKKISENTKSLKSSEIKKDQKKQKTPKKKK